METGVGATQTPKFDGSLSWGIAMVVPDHGRTVAEHPVIKLHI
jgi:hypothetical protein